MHCNQRGSARPGPRFFRSERQKRQERQERQKRQKRHAGEIIPPAPPCFRRRLRPRRGGSVQAKRVAEATSGRDRLRGLGVLGGLCSGCGLSAGVSFRTHLRWPTTVWPSPDSRVKGRDFQMFWREHRGMFAHADRKAVSQRSGARDLSSDGRADGHK